MTSLHDVQRPAASRLLWSLETGSSATSTGLPPRRPLGHANTGLNSIPMSNQMHMKSFAGPPFKDREHFAHPARQFTIEPKTLPVSQKMAIGAIGDGRRSKHSEMYMDSTPQMDQAAALLRTLSMSPPAESIPSGEPTPEPSGLVTGYRPAFDPFTAPEVSPATTLSPLTPENDRADIPFNSFTNNFGFDLNMLSSSRHDDTAFSMLDPRYRGVDIRRAPLPRVSPQDVLSVTFSEKLARSLASDPPKEIGAPIAHVPYPDPTQYQRSPSPYWRYLQESTPPVTVDRDGWVPSLDHVPTEGPGWQQDHTSEFYFPSSNLDGFGAQSGRTESMQFGMRRRADYNPYASFDQEIPVPERTTFRPPKSSTTWMPSNTNPSLELSSSRKSESETSSRGTTAFNPTSLQRGNQSRSFEEDENLNFLQLLQPNAKPPYNVLVHRIVKKSDQQASIFIQQKLKNSSAEERARIVDAIVEKGSEMMQGRFGNWCVQRCLETPCSREDRLKILDCMAGRVVELATNCYGTHVIQKALECEEDIKRVIVEELLENDPSSTLTSKHCSHVWAKVMELSWTDGPPPPIFEVVNLSLRGKWASLACHETGSLVVQTMFENMIDPEDKRIIVDEILISLSEVVKNQWGAFVIQHIIEHGDPSVSHKTSLSLIDSLATYGTHDIAVKSILKILKEKDPLTQDAVINQLCQPNSASQRSKRPLIVDLALSANGSQIIQAVLPEANKDQRGRLYDAVKGHTVTLRGCKTGSRVIWLFDRMRAYYGY